MALFFYIFVSLAIIKTKFLYPNFFIMKKLLSILALLTIFSFAFTGCMQPAAEQEETEVPEEEVVEPEEAAEEEAAVEEEATEEEAAEEEAAE